MSKSVTKLLVSFGILLCLSGFFGTTIARSQNLDPSCSNLSQSPLKKSPSAVLTIEEAIKDTSKPEPCERSTNLIPITKDNPRLIWNDDGQVLMVTWKGDCDSGKESISCKKIRETYPVKKEKSLWLTAVPELKEFVLIQDYLVKQNQTGGNLSSWLSSRLKQYLGLKPNSNYTRFVEVWVNPKDLIRPCVDQGIDDTECNFPDSNTSYDYDPRQNTTSPTTGFGYTYDWGNRDTDIGASEFVVKAGATVTIHENQSTSDYLQGLTPHLQSKIK